jgi:regulator of protease activity HflC (stomatin/prohibitin superfamily)
VGTQIGSGTSNAAGIVKAVLIGTLPAAFCYYLLRVFFGQVSAEHLPFSLSGFISFLSMSLWGVAAAWLYVIMVDNTRNVRPGFEGVHTVFGGFTGLLYGVGDHPFLPGVENVIEVDKRDQIIDPPPFQELARDNVPVKIDGYSIVRIANSIKYLMAIEGLDVVEALKKLLDAEIRLFVAQWERAEDLVEERELLARFLKLPDRKGAEYRRLRKDLLALTKGKEAPLTKAAVANILADAGTFHTNVVRWGLEVVDIHMEGVDLPEEIKAAASKAAAARNEMKVHEVRQERRLHMIVELKKKLPGISERDAITAIDQLLDLAVKRSIVEVDIRDLKEVSKNFGPNVARALAAIFNNLSKKGA